MAKILVTGGAGFVGSHVVSLLLAHGNHVVVLDNMSSGREDLLRPHRNLDLRRGDVTDMAAVRAALDGCDHVVHCAMLSNAMDSLERPNDTFHVNVGGFQTLLEAVREVGMMGWLVFGSSAAVYGTQEIATVREEDAAGVAPAIPLAAANMMNELQARLYRDVFGIRTVGLRLFNVYGPGQDGSGPHAPLLARVVHSVNTGALLTIYGDGTQTRDFVSVFDVAAVVRRIMDYPPSADLPPVVNVGCGQAVSLLDAIRQVVALKQVNPRVEYRPGRGRDIKHSCAETARLRALMGGWQPKNLSEGLRGWLVPSS